MKLYEAPDFTKIELYTEDVLVLGDSILEPSEGTDNGNVEIGKIPLFN